MDTAIPITAGSGTNVDTRTEATNGNHRQVVVVGDPSTNAGVAPVDATAGLKVDLGTDNDVTVSSGTITETNSTAILADTANMDTNLGIIAGDTTSIDGKITACNTGAVVVSSGAITETNSTAILADTASMDTNLGTVAGAVSGSEMQVDVVASLPAGTNNIGDVDVLTTPIDGSINGPGEPTIDSYTQAAISAVTGANQSIVAAPGASKQIWVYGINFGNTTAGTVAFQDEDDTAITGAMPFADNGGMAVSPSGNFAMPLWKVATNKALEADVTTGTINGSITYAIVSV